MAQKGRRRTRSPNRRRSSLQGKASRSSRRGRTSGTSRRQSGRSSGGSRLASGLWFLGGLGLGLLLLLPIFYLSESSPDAAGPSYIKKEKAVNGEQLAESPKGSRSKEGNNAETSGTSSDSETPGKEKGEKGMDYRFYTLLPRMEVTLGRREPQKDTVPLPRAPSPSSQPSTQEEKPRSPVAPDREEPFLLQVASFRENRAAEELKARLALQGLKAKVIKSQLKDRGTWYRVRLGPYPDREAAKAVRARLDEAGMDSMILQR